jgi:hypothetical protein
MENLSENFKQFYKQVAFYSMIVISLGVGVAIGYYYNLIATGLKSNQVNTVKKTDIQLAIDENNHLIVIDKKTWNYTIYQDSVGYNIFNLYAKNIWGQASNPKPKTVN